MRAGLLAAAAALSLLASCSRPATQLVVVVSSDLLPADLACVHVAVARVGSMEPPAERWFELGTSGLRVPFSFGVTAPDGDASGRVEITASAVRDGCGAATLEPAQVTTDDRVRTGFLEGQSIRVSMFLARSCVGLVCPEGSACREGTCVDVVRDAGPPEPIDQGGEIPPIPDVNVAFITRTRASGAFGGPEAADAICAREAAEAGLPGTFVALVETGMTSPIARLGSASGWIRTDRRTVAVSRDALLAEPLVHPVALDAFGARVPEADVAWSNLLAIASQDCAGWSSESPSAFGGVGYPWSVVAAEWYGSVGAMCSMPARFYCFQVDHAAGAPPDVLTEGGRRIFVSDEGDTSPDALCESSRQRAGAALEGTSFRALVAFTGASALSRVTLDERPWVRMDGRSMFLDRVNVTSDRPRLPVLFDATGAPSNYQVATGAGSLGDVAAVTRPGTAEGTCGDWASTTGRTIVGQAASAGTEWFFSGVTGGCSARRRFYCLEE